MSNVELSLVGFPLVNRYFGDYLRKLAGVRQTDPEYKGYFGDHAFHSQALEKRLQKVEILGLTQAIVDEVGDTDNAQELDRRLMDAWAEVRTLDQLQREGFTNLRKVRDIADFTALLGDLQYAIQVTHINRRLPAQIARRNEPGLRSATPYGPIDDIYERLAEPISYLFWDSVQQKNWVFRSWSADGWRRCIVLVTNELALQDDLVRHITCRQLRDCICELAAVHFEELFWLLDNGNGARFLVGSTPDQTKCFADWKDELPGPDTHFVPADVNLVTRREVDLAAWFLAWRDGSGRAV
jgi:hypothetical protein